MNRHTSLLTAATIAAGIMAMSGAAEAKTKIKLGTLAPEGSPWFNAIKRVGQRWKEASKGKVDLKIYPGGVAGDEGDMLRKIRIGQLQAGTVTSIGLGRITRSTIALQIPMMIQSYEELDYVRDRMAPEIEKKLGEAGFVVLNWGDAGWVHYFSKDKGVTPDDFRKMKLFVWSGDPEAEKAWRSAGFNPVPMSSTDVLSGLQTGLIDSFATTPLYALSSQWFGLAKHMVPLPWAPLNGATIISKKTWESIDPALRAELAKIAVEEGEAMKREIRELGPKAVQAMKDRGLEVHEPTKAQLDLWQAAAEGAYPTVRGKVVDEADFDKVQALVREYRARSP